MARDWEEVTHLERELHQLTTDWPGPPLARADPRQVWQNLDRPTTLLLRIRELTAGQARVHRVWVTRAGVVGADNVVVPWPHVDRTWDQFPAAAFGAALLPLPVLTDLAAQGTHDDLLIVGDDSIRAIPLPMASLEHFDPGERLVAYAAVSVVPNLSWALAAQQHRTSTAPGGRTLAFVHPGLPFADIEAQLRNRQQHEDAGVVRATSLRDVLHQLKHPERQWATLVMATHARLAPDRSVEFYDHEGHTLGPSHLVGLNLPPVIVLAGCRALTASTTSPLHLAEALLAGGARHVIGPVTPADEPAVDEILGDTIAGLRRNPASSPAQELQRSTLRFLRAHPHESDETTRWSLMHVGLPGPTGMETGEE